LLKSEKITPDEQRTLESLSQITASTDRDACVEQRPNHFAGMNSIEKPWQTGLTAGVFTGSSDIPRKTAQRGRGRVEFPQRECYDYVVHELLGKRAATALR
jgi:hypothetical protein